MHTIQLETSVPIMEEGWVNKPKGLRQVLWERGFINERHWKKYKVTGNKKNDFNDDGSLKEESKPYILSELMATCADFSNERTDLQHLADTLSDSATNVDVMFTPKYHCEMAGEGIEYAWGFVKKTYRKLPMSMKKKAVSFFKALRKCLEGVDVDRARKFSRRARKYMLAYQAIAEKSPPFVFYVMLSI
jgi:hypothetical protein